MNINNLLAAAQAKAGAVVASPTASNAITADASSTVKLGTSPAVAPAVIAKPTISLAPQKQQSAMPSVNMDSFMQSAKNMAGMATPANPQTPEEVEVFKAHCHAQIKENIEKMQCIMNQNHPLLPQLITRIKNILNQNNQLVLELSPEDIGAISQGCYEASSVVIATKAASSRGKKTYGTADLL